MSEKAGVHFSEDVENDQENMEERAEDDDENEENGGHDEDEAENEDDVTGIRPKPSVFHSAETRVTENLSRFEILNWINSLMESDLKKIEELGTGIVYCLLTNRLFPGSVDLNRIKYRAKSEQAYIQNFRILQATFKKLLLNKIIPVHRLVKCGFHDNFEFAQWFKKFFDENYKGQPPYGHLELDD